MRVVPCSQSAVGSLSESRVGITSYSSAQGTAALAGEQAGISRLGLAQSVQCNDFGIILTRLSSLVSANRYCHRGTVPVWSMLRCSIFRADRCAFDGTVSKMGLRPQPICGSPTTYRGSSALGRRGSPAAVSLI